MASEKLREESIAGNGIDFERLASDSLAPLESFHRIIHRDGVVEPGDLSGHEVSDILGVLLNHARETILRAGGVALIALALTMALFTSPTPGHAADKQVTVTGVADCGQHTCSIMPAKGSGQPMLNFVIKSKIGDKILKQEQVCSSKPLQVTALMDTHENITKLIKVSCAK